MAKTFTTISPIDNSAVLTKKFNSRSELEEIVKRSEEAFSSWKKVDLESKQSILSKFLESLVSEKDVLAKELTEHMGRPIRYTASELTTTKLRGDYLISVSSEMLKPTTIVSDDSFKKVIVKEPLGVVLFLAPWNYPYLTTINGLVPSLLAGNTVVMKVSPQTPNIAETYQKHLQKAGLPKDVFQAVHVDNEDIDYLCKLEKVKFVNFTGSVPNGKSVRKSVSDTHYFKGVCLELGGKDPALVLKDCDLNYTVEQLVDGSMFNSGQSCCSVERIYVHKSIFNQFVEKFGYILDDPRLQDTTLGPMVSLQSAKLVREHIEEAVKMGAKAWIDEAHFPKAKVGTTYVAPQVLTQVNHKMRVMTEETFGPVVGIMPVEDDNEAIRLMNDSPFGLTASIWTQDETKVGDIGAELEFGTVFMNRCDYPDPALPWSGRKLSGQGYSLSKMGFEPFTVPKSYHLKLKL